MAIKITVEGKARELNPEKDVQIDPDNLNEEFIRLPTLLNKYGLLLEMSQAESAALKFDLDRVYAQEDHRIRTHASTTNIKMTEKMVENEVKTSERFREHNLKYLDANRNVGMLKSMLNALRSKQACLISIGANLRSDGASPRVMMADGVGGSYRMPNVDASTKEKIRESREDQVKKIINTRKRTRK